MSLSESATDAGRRVEPQPRAETPWRTVFVVGAGRSGTSAITRGLQTLGVDLGDNLKAPTGKNPTGFFEDLDLLDVAKRARKALGLRKESVALLEPEAFDCPELDRLAREAAGTVQQRFGKAPVWGFKYAQTLRLLPFWEEVFRITDLDARYIVAVRNPLSVARSRLALDPHRGVQEKSDLEWLVNVVPFFRRMSARPFVVVDYDLLMEDARYQLERVARELELPLDDSKRSEIRSYAESFLSEGHRHYRFGMAELDASQRINPLVRDAYGWLRRLASDEVKTDDPALWEDWGRIEATLEAMAPLLRHVDALERELAGTRWSPMAALRSSWINLPRVWSR